MNTFENSLHSSYFEYVHLLDGLVNNDVGYNNSGVERYLRENYNLDESICIIFNVNMINNSINDNTITFSEMIKTNKYYIYPVGNNSHATTIIFKIYNGECAIFTINTGLGTEIHKNILTNGKKLIEPFISYKLNNDTIDDDIKLIFILEILYIVIDKYNTGAAIFTPEQSIQTIKDINYIIRWIIQLKNNIKNNKYSLDIFGTIYSEQNTAKININNYYIFKNEVYKSFFNKNEVIINNNINMSNININMSNINVNERLKDKITPKIIDKKIYICPQESGSCLWYSIYWSIILYYLLINDNMGCEKIINEIFKKSYDRMQEIFTENNFKIENERDNNQMGTMIFLYKKLKLLNILTLQTITNIDNCIENLIYENINVKPNVINIKTSNIEKFFQFTYNDVVNVFNEKESFMLLFFNYYSNNDIYFILAVVMYYSFYCYGDSGIGRDIFRNDITKNYEFSQTERAKFLFKKYEHVCKFEKEKINNDMYPSFVNTHYMIAKFALEMLYTYGYKKIQITDENIIKVTVFLEKITLLLLLLKQLFYDNYDKNDKNIVIIVNNFLHFDLTASDVEKIHDKGTLSIFLYSGTEFSSPYLYINLEVFYWCEYYTYDYNKNIKFNKYLLDNPKLIYNNIAQFNEKNKDKKITYYFITLNIFEIYKNETQHQKLINELLILIYEQMILNKNINNNIIYNMICDLILLYDIDQLTTIINNNIHECKLKYELYYKILKKYSKYTCDIFIEKSNTYFIETANILSATIKKIKKHFPNNIIKTNEKENEILIDNIIYIYINLKNTPFDIFLDKMYNPPNTICLYSDKTNKLYIITDILYEFDVMTNYIKNIIKINKIKINNNEVIRFKDVNYPFKYVMPQMGPFQYIYKNNNDVYEIKYLLKKSKYIWLYNKFIGGQIDDDINFNITINKNNMMYINNNLIDVSTFNKIFLTLDPNKYNMYFYNNDNKLHLQYAFLPNDQTLGLINYDKLFIDKKIEKINIKNEIVFEKQNKIDVNILHNDIYYNDSKNIESKNKLIKKIQSCLKITNIEQMIHRFKYILDIENKNSKHFMDYFGPIKSYSFDYIMEKKADIVYDYLIFLRYSYVCKDLLNIINKKNHETELCAKIKIYSEQMNSKKYNYKYMFEFIFEILFGNEITNEQFNIYLSLINSYIVNILNGEQHVYKSKNILKETSIINIMAKDNTNTLIGGNNNKYMYPIQHLMMGKGKSSVITPLLILYFTLIEKKNSICDSSNTFKKTNTKIA